MQKIVPHLWFDKEAKQAAEFYISLFPQSKITNSTVLHDTPSGDCDVISFDLWGYSFMAISAGPLFKFNPSISFMINFDPGEDTEARERIDRVWDKLKEGGKILMPIDKYPFSERYGWIEDKFGLTWQLMLTNPEGEKRPKIIPFLLFVRDVAGKAEQAINHYLSIFKNSKIGNLIRHPSGMENEKEGSVMFADFMLENQWFCAMDSSDEHMFSFNEAISLMVNCDTQEEIDYYWEKLSAVPDSEQCGWLKDRYGVSWQIQPTILGKMMEKGTSEQVKRVTEAFLKMKKFNIAELEKAYRSK